MNTIGFRRTLFVALGISCALTLTACGDGGYDCADAKIKETVYSLVRAPNMLVGLLVSTTSIQSTGPLGHATIGQWVGRVAGAKRWPERKKQIEERIGTVKNVFAYWSDQEQPIENLKKRVSDTEQQCNSELSAMRMRSQTSPQQRPTGYRPPSCDLNRTLKSELFAIFDRREVALRNKPEILQEIKNLEAELTADHRDPPEGEQLVQLKFTEISEQERKSDEKRVVCRGQLSVKIMYPEVMDLGTAGVLYSVQPNLATPGNLSVRVNLL